MADQALHSGNEPALGGEARLNLSGLEPMLGGAHRPRLDRALFWDLLDMDRHRRLAAVERVLDQAMGRYYGAAMAAVLSPEARYFKVGVLWKVPYSYEQKLAAMDCLVRLDVDRALAALVMALNHDDVSIQQAAIWFIGRLESAEAEQVLLAILDDDRPELRYAAVRALSERWDVPVLARLASRRPAIVAQAVNWLGEHGPGCVVAPLAAILRDRHFRGTDRETVQSAVVTAIGLLAHRFGGEHAALAVQALRDLLNGSRVSQPVVMLAIQALHLIGTEDALAAAIVYQASHEAAQAG